MGYATSAVSMLLAATLATVAAGQVPRDSVLATPSTALAERLPTQVGDEIISTGGDASPRRRESCATTCRIDGLNRVETKICRPYIDPEALPATAQQRLRDSVLAPARPETLRVSQAEQLKYFRSLPDGRLQAISTVQQCDVETVQTFYSQTFQPRSAQCWVSASTYCRYDPRGRTGYPCNCRGRPGYFG